MQIHIRPRPDTVHAALDALRLLAAQLAGALADALARVGAGDTGAGRWLRRVAAAEVAAQLYAFKNHVVALAFATAPGVPVRRRRAGMRRGVAPPGFRRARWRGSAFRHLARPAMRRLMAGVRAGDLAGRCAALAAALADPAPYAAMIAARMRRVRAFARLIAVAPPAQGLNFCEDCVVLPVPDSS